MRRWSKYCLFIGVISDFLTPYVLGLFDPTLNQFKDVMSLIGDVGSPVRTPFLIWSVVAGTFYCLGLPYLYQVARPVSKLAAWLLVLSIGLYGVSDCIFTGLFSVDTHEASWNLSTWIHNIGSGVGYSGFFIFPLLAAFYAQQKKDKKSIIRYLQFFVLSIVVALGYALARVPELQSTLVFGQLGLWQRISFLCNYFPILYFIKTETVSQKKPFSKNMVQ
ncbi:DUF998 domain-containing protein [Enterococcus sp. AZ102]|uniref:DUF998 domain-containing protein n=1 Tax=Enterococcus sp. AZ102 TaxID=2774865 RepID=UPI003F23BECA